MILYIQAILIAVLVLILGALYIEEKHRKRNKIPEGKLIQVWDGSERRRFVRIPATTPIRYSFPKKTGHVKAAKIKDVSIGGICIVINEKLSLKSDLCLEIAAAGNPNPIFAKGEVIWIKEAAESRDNEGVRYFNIGVEFKDILPKDRERLSIFIRESGQL